MSETLFGTPQLLEEKGAIPEAVLFPQIDLQVKEYLHYQRRKYTALNIN